MSRLRKVSQSLFAFFATLFVFKASALTFDLPKSGNVIGHIKTITAKQGETLQSIAQREGVGALQIASANPKLNSQAKLHAGVEVVLPLQFILPDAPFEGIVINLAELRLYYFPKDSHKVITEPVGIGREGHWQTPRGTTKVVKKEEDPIWHPTANVRAEALKHGTPIPYAFPPGPDNPLGKYILRLGWPTYLIHGTNHPEGVGSRVSAGCIRMLPKSAKRLYDSVAVGTKVRVINQPYKLGWQGRKLMLEAHKPLKDSDYANLTDFTNVVTAINDTTATKDTIVQWTLVKSGLAAKSGLPKAVGYQVASTS